MKRAPKALKLHAIAGALALLGGSAGAAEIDTGNPDLKIRWDNTIRYNLGARVEKQDPRILAGSAYDEGDSKFGKGKIVTNRFDLLSEFDLNYAGTFGTRLTAAGWYDDAYRNRDVTSPAGVATSYFNNQYNSKVKRYINGPSAEFLDAFAWANFNAGDVPVNIKVGRHALVWGEGVFIGAHAISYSQAPTDGQKAVSSPGIETKEVVLPLNQISFKAQVTSDLTIAGQYFLEWKETRAPNGGGFLTGADTAPNVDQLGFTPTFAAINQPGLKPKNTGNWGLMGRLNVEAIDSTLGLYYREFTDYNPANGLQFLTFAGPLPATFRFIYPKNTKLIGLSLSKGIGPFSFGSELSYRKNAALNSSGVNNANDDVARGDTLHAIATASMLLPKTAVWETGSLAFEFAYSRLQKVTTNPQLYKGVGYAACTAVRTPGVAAGTPGNESDACSSKDFFQVAASLAPQWLAVAPSWDLSVPISINYGIKGVAPTSSGGFEKLLSWSIGANLTYQAKHEFSLRYADIVAPSKYGAPNANGVTPLIGGGASGGSLGATDRGWLVLTYRTAF